MQFVYDIVSTKELTSTERMILALRGEEFTFLRSKGVVKINAAMPKVASLVKLAKSMWEIDRLLDSVDGEIMDGLWKKVKKIAGEDAASKLYKAWGDALQEKLEKEAEIAAKDWLCGRNLSEEMDSISDTVEYSSRFIKALWRETTDTDAVFVYGYQLGLQAARQGGTA